MQHQASLQQALQRLSELEIFQGLSESQLNELVAVGEIAECAADVVLFKEGDVGDKMYLIIEGSLEVTTEAVQIFGGAGYMRATRVEQLMRDAKILQIYAGTDEMQITAIAKDLLSRP